MHPRLGEGGSASVAEYFRGGVLSSRVHLIKVHPSRVHLIKVPPRLREGSIFVAECFRGGVNSRRSEFEPEECIRAECM